MTLLPFAAFAEERVRHEVQEHVAEQSTGRKGDHGVQGRRLEGGWNSEEDEVGDSVRQPGSEGPVRTHDEM